MMKFHDLSKIKPQNGQLCLIKERGNTNQLLLFNYPQFWYDDVGFLAHSGVIKWAPLPKHITINPKGWYSQYRGDEMPTRDCLCVVCVDNKPWSASRMAYYKQDKDRFLGYQHGEVIAWMEI